LGAAASGKRIPECDRFIDHGGEPDLVEVDVGQGRKERFGDEQPCFRIALSFLYRSKVTGCESLAEEDQNILVCRDLILFPADTFHGASDPLHGLFTLVAEHFRLLSISFRYELF